MRLRLLLEYEGTRYHGWQVQENADTVQQRLEEAVFRITGETVRIRAAGRTDAGVHARGQVADFLAEQPVDPGLLMRGVNAVLPDDIAVLKLEQASDDFNPQLWARHKSYRYRIWNRRERSALARAFSWYVGRPLDLAAMREGADHLLGEHDFSAFRAANCSGTKPVQTMSTLSIDRDGEGMITIDVTATGFLKHMVRTIVGTLVEVGLSRMPTDDVRTILDGKDRTKAGPNAPACGLFLWHVDYEDGFGHRATPVDPTYKP